MAMQPDTTFLKFQEDHGVPLTCVSENIIAREAPAALRNLKRRGHMDLADALGLTPHLNDGGQSDQ